MFSQGAHETQENKGPGHQTHFRIQDGHTSHFFRKLWAIQAHCGQMGKRHHFDTLPPVKVQIAYSETAPPLLEMMGTPTFKEIWKRGDTLNELGQQSI